MSRKKGVHKHLPSTLDEVLIAVASNRFDEKKRKKVFKKKKPTKKG